MLGSQRSTNKIAVALIAVSVVGLVTFLVLEGPWLAAQLGQSLTKLYGEYVSPRLSAAMRLEHVEWQELTKTNLSPRVPLSVLEQAAGLQLGQETLSVDLVELEKRLLSVPWLESVAIQKILPSTISIRYQAHKARALALKKGRLWLISNVGKWIAPVDAATDRELLDLPVLSNEDAIEGSLSWLNALEKETPPPLLSVHEINLGSVVPKMTAVVELKYRSEPRKVSVIGLEQPKPESLVHLRRVAEYLVRNGIDVSTIDIRPGKRVIVNVRH